MRLSRNFAVRVDWEKDESNNMSWDISTSTSHAMWHGDFYSHVLCDWYATRLQVHIAVHTIGLWHRTACGTYFGCVVKPAADVSERGWHIGFGIEAWIYSHRVQLHWGQNLDIPSSQRFIYMQRSLSWLAPINHLLPVNLMDRVGVYLESSIPRAD